MTGVALEQLRVFSAVDRDPRERVVSVAHFGLVKGWDRQVKAADDAAKAQWFPVSKLPKLAFDHAEMLRAALRRLRGNTRPPGRRA
jgi:8-oxo-dGTP diphosphatase